VFIGSAVALVTPFKDGKVNYEVLKKLINFHIENNTDAIVVCGTTGESGTLTNDERKEIFEFSVKEVNGRVPLIAGTGKNITKDTLELTKSAKTAGADCALIVTPYYNKTSPKGLIEHYSIIADETNFPIIMYNVPSRTGMNVKPETVYELSKNKNIIGIKEASADINQIIEIARLCGDTFSIYSGNDDHILPVLSIGGKGVISTVANIAPKETSELVHSFFNGDIKKSRDLQFKLTPLIRAVFIEVNPIPIKTALRLLGWDVGELRRPLTEMSPENLEILKREMKKFGFKI